MRQHRQNLEADAIGALIGIAACALVVSGLIWALVQMIRWLI